MSLISAMIKNQWVTIVLPEPLLLPYLYFQQNINTETQSSHYCAGGGGIGQVLEGLDEGQASGENFHRRKVVSKSFCSSSNHLDII